MSRPEEFLSFSQLHTGSDVAAFLGVSWDFLRYALYRIPEENRYRSFKVLKRSGNLRTIDAPCPQIRKLQEPLKAAIEMVYRPSAPVHGFAFERSIITNARQHVGARWLINVDLKDFFPSIHIGRVIGLYNSWPFLCGGEAATVLGQVCTHRKKLPQGAITSPVISNMVCFKLDRVLLTLAKRSRCQYTRYADDITFSSRKEEIPEPICKTLGGEFEAIGDELNALIQAHGFAVNPEKVSLQRRTRRMVVTGLKINAFPNVRRSLIRQIRAMLYAWKKFGLERAQHHYDTLYDRKTRRQQRASFRHVLAGKITYLGQVRGRQDKIYNRFAQQLFDLDPKLIRWHPLKSIEDMVRDATCVLTNDDGSRSGTGFHIASVGLVTCWHVAEFATKVFYANSPEKEYPVKCIAFNQDSDLAICQSDI
jgi:RNA-directed DNA polymerase